MGSLTASPNPDRDDPAKVAEEISDSANSLFETLIDALPRLGVAASIVVIGYLASRVLRIALFRLWKKRQTPSFAQVMSKLAGWVLLSMIVLAAITVTFPSVRPVDLLAGLGFFSLAVGFAFQDILENSLSGVLLLFRQPFTSGDQIQVVNQDGVVEGITIRETRIRAFDGELIVIPNRDVYKNVIVVTTERPIHRQSFTVGVGYDADVDIATGSILRALSVVPDIKSDPAPSALISELGVSTVNIEVRFWNRSDRGDSLRIRDQAIRAVKHRLDADGIEMPADIIELQPRPMLREILRKPSE